MAREVKVAIIGDASGLRRAFGDADRAAGGFSTSMRSHGAAIAGAVAGAFAVDRIADWGGQLFQAGQQAEVARIKVATVFEGQADAVKQWADANNEAFGTTDEKLAGMAANFGDLLKPMGFTADEAAKMSQDVIGLSAALSAWTGGTRDAAEVSMTLSKAMLGEREELKGLGISISDAEVDARAAALSQQGLGDAADQTTRAIATQQLIFEKSTDAQKAWNDGTFDSIQKSNELKANVEELKEALANGLRPAFEAVTGYMVDELIPTFEAWGAWGVASKLGSDLLAKLGMDPATFQAGLKELKRIWEAEGLEGVFVALGDAIAQALGFDAGAFEDGLAALDRAWDNWYPDFRAGLDDFIGSWDNFWDRFRDGLNILHGEASSMDKKGDSWWAKANDFADWLNPLPSNPVFGNANGGSIPEGLSLVGERGAELAVKRGSHVQIIPADQTARQMGPSAAGNVINLTVNGHDWSLGQALDAAAAKMDWALTMRAS